jgi:transposase-like protein
MRHYSNEMRETMVKKLCSPGGPSIYQLSKETGISQGSLYKWVQSFGEGRHLKKKHRSVDDWSPEQKLKAVIETAGLSEEELGEYLRKNGLHSSNIDEWRQAILSGFASKPGRPRKDPELATAQEELKLLKRDLRRKERALAEQTALVILQKKAEKIWGKYEDDESD